VSASEADISRPATWHTTLFALIGHPSEPKVMLQGDERAMVLPQCTADSETRWLSTQDILGQLEAVVGGKLFPLRWVSRVEDDGARRIEAVLELELLSSPEETELHWADRHELYRLALAYPAQRVLIERMLDERSTGVYPAKRVSWARPGWHEEAKDWIDRQISGLATSVASVDVVRSWYLSCVLRIETTSGKRLFFKSAAVLPLFVNEAAFTAGLADVFPECTPRPLAIDADRNWMVLADLGGEIEWKAPLEHRQRLMRSHAALQIDSTRRVERLLAIGAIDRRLDWTIAQIGPVLSDLDRSGLTADEIERLQSLAPALEARCRELTTFRIPPALVHGDLHCGNVAFRPDDLTIFDWTDACITHPFFDMLAIYMEEDAVVQATLRDIYLSAWTDFEPMDRLETLWALAEPAFALHHLISYVTMARHVESAGMGSEATVARFARLLLRTMST
jgi:aminoglycoside phosphotransferase (APT) family kinase protein